MSKKSIWLLGFLMLALVFGGLSSARAQLDDIEAFGIDGDGNGDAYGPITTGVIVNGEAGDRETLGNAYLMVLNLVNPADAETSVASGGEEDDLDNLDILDPGVVRTALMGLDYTADDVDDAKVTLLVEGELWLITTADDDKERYLVHLNGGNLNFFIPDWIELTSEALAAGGHDLDGLEGTTIDGDDELRSNHSGDVDFSFKIPPDIFGDEAPIPFVTALIFMGDNDGADMGALAFSVQVPSAAMFKEIDLDPNDPMSNGDTFELDVDLEDFSDNGLENFLILLDPSNIDSTFHLEGNDPDEPDDDMAYSNAWDDGSTFDLEQLVKDTQAAIASGKLEIVDRGNGRYTLTYTISEDNKTEAGVKVLSIRVVAFAGTLEWETVGDIYAAFSLDPDTDVAIGEWMTGWATGDDDLDVDSPELDNTPPNFDMAFLGPYGTPNSMPHPGGGAGEFAYVYNEGATVQVMVQIDPDDLNKDEIREVDADDIDPFGTEGLYINDIEVIGDISALLDPNYLAANSSDSNNNGIIDVAEVRADYAGRGGGDEDYDGEEDNREDDEDSTQNGINERFLFVFQFVVGPDFKGVSTRPATTDPMPIRFAIIDGLGNIKHFSAWREVFDADTGDWMETTVAGWEGPDGRSPSYVDGNGDGIIDGDDGTNPVLLDDDFPPDYNGGSTAFAPNPALHPPWSNGRTIIENWDKPWQVIIDTACPNVSVFQELSMGATTADSSVAKGAAVVPGTVNLAGATDVLLTGDFIYELTGNESSLVSMDVGFPSDNDVWYAVFQYSADGTNFVDMKGTFLGDVNVPGLYDIAGVARDGAPGADEDAGYHDALNGDDDNDGESDTGDHEVRDAMMSPRTDTADNDADGLVDSGDVDDSNVSMEIYNYSRDDDEDGIMDEDAHVVMVNGADSARFTFDPVRMSRVLGLLPGKAYAVRAVAYDYAGNVCDVKASPINVVFRVVGEGVQQVAGTATVQLYDDETLVTGKTIYENRLYGMEAAVTGTVESVTFDLSLDETNWTPVSELSGDNPDTNAPFNIQWRPTLVAGGIDADGDGVADPGTAGYVAGDDLYLRATPGKFGELGLYDVVNGLTIDEQTFAPYTDTITVPVPPEEADADMVVAVVDSSAPVVKITQLGTDAVPDDGALIPVATDVLLKAEVVLGATDISDAYWELAVAYPDGTRAQWTKIICTTDKNLLNSGKVVSSWNTTDVAPGMYDIRCVAVDENGLSDPEMAPIAHIVIGYGKKVAFIEEPSHGATVAGMTEELVGRIYFDWLSLLDTDSSGSVSEAEEGAMVGDIVRVFFQYRLVPSETWLLADSVPSNAANIEVEAAYADWFGSWDLYDLEGTYEIRAVVEDDKGYRTEGIPSLVTVAGSEDLRTQITNFYSDEDENDRVSMHLAREGGNSYIYIYDRNNCDGQGMTVKLLADELPGTIEPDQVVFEYKINWNGSSAMPKGDDGWTEIGRDVPADGFVMEWKIANDHELHNLTTATLVYVRARAVDGNADLAVGAAGYDGDMYADETDFVPFVGLVFEETVEPTATIAKRLRGDDSANVDLDNYKENTLGQNLDVIPNDEYRLTTGTSSDREELIIIPSVFDNHPLGNAQQMSPLAKVELWYKLCRLASRDGDTLLWQLAASSTESPYVLTWDYTDIPTGKYEILVVLTDKAGNRSANPWCSELETDLVTIDHEGPTAYVENPDNVSDDGRLSCDDRNILVAVSSYQGCIDTIILEYGREGYIEDIPSMSQEETYTFEWQDLNSNGVWDPGEPWRISGLPTDTGEGDWVEPGVAGDISWTKIGESTLNVGTFAGLDVYSNFVNADENIAGTDNYPYWYHDKNGNGRFDAGEPVWKDKAGGNRGRYNYHDRTVKEDLIVGGLRPGDEAVGKRFEDIPPNVKDYNCTEGTTKWVDMNGDGEFDEEDFIWIDIDGDNEFGWTSDGICEPVVYASVAFNWDSIYDLPPTNNSLFDLRARATDKKDSAGKAGNWGPYYIGPIRVQNIQVAVQAVNGRAIGDFTNIYRRISGDTVDVTVRVYPEPESGAEVELWFRYDDALYPGGPDANLDGKPDGNVPANSRWDGIDNDWDGVVDEEQKDKDGNDKKWGEVNTWQQAVIISSSVTGRNSDENWFEVTVTWDVSMLEGEFQYNYMPVVVDSQNFGVNINYSTAWVVSSSPFPQDCKGFGRTLSDYNMIIDHQGPYTYTQIVLDSDDMYATYQQGLASWKPLDACTPDDMSIRTNDAAQGYPNNDRNPTGDYTDEAGEDNYQTFDLQAKVVSQYGGLDFTKSFDETSGGVEFQYRVAGGEWMTLGYDYEPDLVGSYVYDVVEDEMMAVEVDRGYPTPMYTWNGDYITYCGEIVDHNGDTQYGDTTTTQRITITTWSLDNINIKDSAYFPSTGIGSEEYQFRTIAKDLPDIWGSAGTRTGDTATTPFDVAVVKNRVGDGKQYAADNCNYMRDIDWQFGLPFEAPELTSEAIFINPHVDVGVEEYVMGPRNDGKDTTYTVNNVVPEAAIYQVDTSVFPWTAEAGVDSVSLEGEIDANVYISDQVVVKAVANPDPSGVGVWGETPDVAGDIVDGNGHAEVRLYARPYPDPAANSYKGSSTNKWKQVGMGDANSPLLIDPESTQSDFPNEGNIGYTFRIAVANLKNYFDDYTGCDYELAVIAIDKQCNAEPMPSSSGELVIRVQDFVGPDIVVGGLALDSEHYSDILNRLDFGGIAASMLGSYLLSPFTDMAGLDMNNMGNAVFPANPSLVMLANDGRNPLAKVSGELLHLYALNCCDDCEGAETITFTIYDKSNTVVFEDVVTRSSAGYDKDTGSGDTFDPARIKHSFTLSEQTAMIYLPAWTDVDGTYVPRFENVWLRYKAVDNGDGDGEECVPGSGTYVAPPEPLTVTDKVAMSRYVNSKGENIWKVDMNLEMGKTYFYYFLVDTVGNTWTIPDPKNLMFDEFLNGQTADDVYASMEAYTGGMGNTVAYQNIPVISKLWVPGTPKSMNSASDDEIFTTIVDLDLLPDGVYEIRVTGADKVGFEDIVSKTVVLDRTPPAVDPDADIKVDGRIKSDTDTTLIAILHDPPSGVNVVDTNMVLFTISRRGNTEDAIGVWQYAIDGKPIDLPSMSLPEGWQDVVPSWVLDPSLDVYPGNGWEAGWHTPVTDQNIEWHVRPIPIDDAMNVQIQQSNQVKVIIDGSVPKVKIVKASVSRAGATIEAAADEFDLYPDDTDVLLTAELVENMDGDLDGDGIIEADAGEDINIGMDSVTFQYTLKRPADGGGVVWHTIPAAQYSDPQRVPTADGKWQVTWQVDFSQLINEELDQYIELRAVGKDKVGNEDLEDPIHTIMILHDVTGPMAHIRVVDGSNVLDPHLAVTKDTTGQSSDPGAVVVEMEAHNVAALTLEYRAAGATSWTEIDTATAVTGSFNMEWIVASLEEGKYELRISAFDGDGNMMTDPDIVWVIVDHTEPEVVAISMWVDEDRADGYEGNEQIYPMGATPGDAIWRYMDGNGDYYNVKFQIEADATEPIDDKLTEAECVSLQYFDRDAVEWMDVPNSEFTYSKVSDKWTVTFEGKTCLDPDTGEPLNDLGCLFDAGALKEGDIQFRGLVTDYAGNENTLDRNSVFTITADALAPNVIAVYSGGREWEGGDDCTIVADGGDPVDLWVKVMDSGTGVATVSFYIEGSDKNNADDCVFPVPPAVGTDHIGNGGLDWAVGGEELWHLVWNTPPNQYKSNQDYTITAKVTDAAGNSVHHKDTRTACVTVERDVTAPVPPAVLFVETHAQEDGDHTPLYCDDDYDTAQILDNCNASDYSIRKQLALSVLDNGALIPTATNLDADGAYRYEIFDLYTDRDVDTHDDELDTKMEIFVRIPELEYGVQPGATERRQFDDGGQEPNYLKVSYGDLGHDPGVKEVWVWVGFAGDSEDPSAVTAWSALDDNKDDGESDHDPLTLGDLMLKALKDGDGVIQGYAYYLVMGDDSEETVWNTEGAADGNWFIRTQAKDQSGNVGDYGYSMVKVNNVDDIAPDRTIITNINGEDTDEKRPPLEWKWHKVVVRTYRNQDGYWWMGNIPGDIAADNSKMRFFDDTDYVVVEMWDNECSEWVNVTKDGKSTMKIGHGTGDDDHCWPKDRNYSRYYVDWMVYVDSTLVGDGDTTIRPYAVDNDDNVEDRAALDEHPIMVDNPRAQVVLPVTGAIVERGETIEVVGVGVEPNGDPAGNGDDVGQIAFMIKRKPVVPGGIEGPWILLDAKDSDLDGQFGEPGDPVDPSDTNMPYKVPFRVPDWLVIDDPETEHIREDQAQYWVVAVAGDSATGPLNNNDGQRYLELNPDYDPEYPDEYPQYQWVIEGPSHDLIHWDNPYHIIKNDNCTGRAQLITVVDQHPPMTRVLQVADYAVPSEVKMVVGQTVTVFAGDTEVDWMPPEMFPTPPFEFFDTDEKHSFDPNIQPPSVNEVPAAWYTDDAKNIAWSIGMLYPSVSLDQPMYDDDHTTSPVYEEYLYQEWRANGRVTLRYSGPYADDAPMPAFPASGESWEDTTWKAAEADAIHLGLNDDGVIDVGRPKWKVTNWVTGGTVLPDGKYFITVIGTDDVGHSTGIPVGDADRVMPDVVEIFVDNNAPVVTMMAAELQPDGALEVITDNEMERGRAMVLYIDEKMLVEDLDTVTFMFKAKHDYDWKVIMVDIGAAVSPTQPHSITLSPILSNGDAWSGISEDGQSIALGNVYQFKAVVTDSVGNSTSTNIIDLTVVDREAEAAISKIVRLDGFNANELILDPNMINDQIEPPRLTGRVELFGYTDSDTVGVTFLYRPQGADTWTEIEAILNTRDWENDGFDNDWDWDIETDDLNANGKPDPGEPNVDEPGEGSPWQLAEWLTDGLDNDWDGDIDEPGECGLHFEGAQEWIVFWDTTTISGLYEIAVVANTGDNKSMSGFDILNVYIDHNAYDIVDAIEDWTPTDAAWVGGRTRRPVEAENPRLDPDDKLVGDPRGEVDVCVVFADGIPADLDMGISTGVIRTRRNADDAIDTRRKGGIYEGYAPQGSQLDPSLTFEWKYSVYPDVGDEIINDKPQDFTDEDHKYWHPVVSDVIYDANFNSFCAVWRTVEYEILNGYYDIRVRIVDEAGNVAYKVFAERVVVDNTPPAAMITSINDDTTLTYERSDMATDTELDTDANVVVRATAIDSLTDVAIVQFQVKQDTLEIGPPLEDPKDEVPVGALGVTDWTDIGLGVAEDDPENSYSLLWNTTGLAEGEYLLRVKVTDVVGNKMSSGAVRVTVVDTTPPIACIAGYYPRQMQTLNWPKKYWRDTIYAVTICQADIQEVQIQYRAVGENNWITIGVPQWIPFEQLDTMCEKVLKIGDIFFGKRLFPPSVAIDEALNEAFDWTGLWGASWDPSVLPSGAYELRAIAKDWSGNVTPEDMAPVLTIEVEGGVALPETPGNDIEIEFTANLGGIGVGDSRFGWQSYYDTPSVVLTVTAPEKPTVMVLVEVDSPEGVIVGGEVIEVMAEEGAAGRYSAALKGEDLLVAVCNRWEGVGNYLDLIRLGGRITAFASTPTCPGTGEATLAMESLTVYPVTAELGTNGTVYSKDGNVSVTIPRAALVESQEIMPFFPEDDIHFTLVERAGIMITPTGVMPNTPKDQRLHIEPKGQAYNIQFFSLVPKYLGFRPGFEPQITMRYDESVMSHEEPFVSVRYWDPELYDLGGEWANSDIINMRVNPDEKTVTFNVTAFGDLIFFDQGGAVADGSSVDHVPQMVLPHDIFTIIVEKEQGRIDNVVFEGAYVYPAEPDISYLTKLKKPVYFTIVDPGGIDESSIRVYIDDQLVSTGWGAIRFIRQTEDGNVTFAFEPKDVDDVRKNLTEGPHYLKIEAWDDSDAIIESDWRMLEKTVLFYIDCTEPVVVTHTAQKDGVRYFNSVEGATASITLVDEGVGIDGQEMQNDIWVDVFQHLTANQTHLSTKDAGDVINYQRKTLIATSRPILEYCDDYTPDGIDNETWIGFHDGASDVRHPAWRASYTIHVGQISDGDTFEVVFYSEKPNANIRDWHNENAVYLYEDLTKAYLLAWDGGTADSLSITGAAGAGLAVSEDGYYDDDHADHEVTARVVVVPATQVPDLFEDGLLDMDVDDVWHEYYDDTFLEDRLFNEDDDDEWFVRHLIADTRAPVITLDVPEGSTADAPAITISASAIDDASGLEGASLVINGEVVAEKVGPAITASLTHTLGQGEAADSSEIVIMAIDTAGNEAVLRKVLGVQETDAPVISGLTPEGEGVADATPTIAASYSDESGVDLDSVVLTLNGAVITDTTVGLSSVSYTPVEALEAGITYTVKVSVKDSAGEPADAVWTFALETDAPEITDTTPSGVDETGMPAISAKFADAGVGIDVASAKLVLDGEMVDAAITESSASFKPADVLASGLHTAILSVADVAGNVAEHSWEFNIEDTAPAVTDVEPSGTINEDMPVLSAKYSDAGTGVDVDTVALSLNGEVVDADVTDGQVSFGVQEPLRSGVTYIVSVTVADKAGNVGSASSTFELEDRVPTISSTSPTGTVQSVDVAISANYSDSGAGIDQSTALMKVDGAAIAATPSASGISYQATGLLAGDHTVYVEVADKFGNVGSRSWSFSVEQTAPVISAVEPDGEIGDATPVISATYSDAGTGVNVSSVILKLGGEILPAVPTESGVSYKVLTPLEVGVTYKVSVEVADKAGNVASDSSTFSLETDPPKISGMGPKGTVSEEDAAAGIVVEANLSDDGAGVDPDSVAMWINGDAVAAEATTESVQYTAKGLVYGDYNVRLVVADMLGNTADETWSFSVDDATPPTVTVVSPKQDAVVGVRPVIKISYADEGSGVDLTSISVKVDDKAVVATTMAPAKANVVSAGEASYEVRLGYGSHTLTVVVKDVAGNESTAEVTFIVEGDALSLAKAHNYPNPVRGSGTTITFGLSQESDITIRIYDFTATLVATVAEDEMTAADEKVEFAWDGTTDGGDGNQLANGVYFCQILAKTGSETKSEIVKIALVRE